MKDDGQAMVVNEPFSCLNVKGTCNSIPLRLPTNVYTKHSHCSQKQDRMLSSLALKSCPAPTKYAVLFCKYVHGRRQNPPPEYMMKVQLPASNFQGKQVKKNIHQS
jgi:hypothetical protein